MWHEIVVHTTTEGSELVSEMLVELGANGTEVVDRNDVPDPNKPGVFWELYDPKMVKAMPEDVLVKGWFDEQANPEEIVHTLKMLPKNIPGMNFGSMAVEVSQMENEDWGESWKDNYHPFRIGEHFIIKPTWSEYKAQPKDLIIELDPGMAFGTGTHETTNMCLQLLEKYLVKSMRVMDVGTGSGILAIGAALLGAGAVLGVDIDSDAVKVARENAEQNGVSDIVEMKVGDLCKDAAMPCELAIANIVADAVCMLLDPIKRHLEPNGLLICSGIMASREPDVAKEAEACGYERIDRMEMGEWVALAYRKGE